MPLSQSGITLNLRRLNIICIITVVMSLSFYILQSELSQKCNIGDGSFLRTQANRLIPLCQYEFCDLLCYQCCQRNASFFHIVTGLMMIRNDSMTNAGRKAESGIWLAQNTLAKIPKTIYHVDYYHKHVQQLILNRNRMNGRNHTLLHSLSSVYFSSTLLSTPNLKIVPLANPVHAQECGHYLQYIVENYEQLADYSIFLHGNPEDHNPHLFEQLNWLVNQSKEVLSSIDFLHLNCQEYVHRRSTDAGFLLTLLGFDMDAFTSHGNLSRNETSSGMRYFSSQCCAQFMVSSKVIRTYSLDFWKVALKVTLDNKRFCIVWEYMWHAVLLGLQELPKYLTLDHLYQQNNPSFSSRCPNGLRSDQV
jgi:hypothetical protein